MADETTEQATDETVLREVRSARASLDRARARFEESIRSAGATVSSRKIGEAAGLSHQRVHQIIHRQ